MQVLIYWKQVDIFTEIQSKQSLVDKLEKYAWSSYPVYVHKAKTQEWLTRDNVYGELGSHQHYSGYRRFVEYGIDEETRKFYAKKATPAIWGNKHFTEIAYTQVMRLSKEINKSGIVEPIKISRIVAQVARYFELSEEAIYVVQKGPGSKNIARWMAMKLSQDYSGQTITDIGKAFGVSNYCTVSQTITRLLRLMGTDNQVAKNLSTISKDLTPLS